MIGMSASHPVQRPSIELNDDNYNIITPCLENGYLMESVARFHAETRAEFPYNLCIELQVGRITFHHVLGSNP